MTKRQTRMFFVGGTTVFALVFIALTIDSHRQFGRLTHEDALTPQVVAGKHVWHRKDCINCHTLLGEGAYYAPDLTKIAQLRGEPYLRQFLKDPSRFYSEEQHGRLMPNPNLSDEEIGDVIAFLTWVSQHRQQQLAAAADSRERGHAAGHRARHTRLRPLRPAIRSRSARRSSGGRPPAASAAIRRSQGVQIVGPSLAGIGTRAADIAEEPRLHRHGTNRRKTTSANPFFDPSAYVVPGPTFSAGGQSIMPAIYQDMLKPEEIDHLVAYLATLK